MSKYKVGDRVVVISEEKIKDLTKKFLFCPDMRSFCGETVTIKKVDYDGTYRIEEYNYWWSDEFFEGLEEDVKRQYSYNELTKIRRNELLAAKMSDAFLSLAKFCNFEATGLDKLTSEKENNTMNKKDILAVRNYNDRAMVMQFDKKDKNGKNVQTRAEVYDGDTFDLDEGIRICLLKYLLGGHKEYMAIMDAARKSYKKTVKEDQEKATEKYKKAIAPVEKENKKKEKRDKEIEELIANAIKKALAETRESENKTVEE